MSRLTQRESEIAALVTQGKSNREIANYLAIDVKTVKFHVTNILAKSKVTSRAQLINRRLRPKAGNEQFFKLMASLLK